MNENIAQSRTSLLSGTGWVVDEDTFQVLDETKRAWIARVTTTHLQKQGKPEQSFYVLASLGQYVRFYAEELVQLKAYLKTV